MSHNAPSGPEVMFPPNAAESRKSVTTPAVVTRSTVDWSSVTHSAPSGPEVIRPGVETPAPLAGTGT